jgi:uncharacterized membrane protein
MKPEHFLSEIQHDRVRAAIQAAEQGTSARVVVYVSHHPAEDALAAAHGKFRDLCLESEKENANLLLFFSPGSRSFAVVGGTALHDRLGQVWWDRLSELLGRHFQEGQYTEGLLAAIGEAGRAFKAHFAFGSPAPPDQPDVIED